MPARDFGSLYMCLCIKRIQCIAGSWITQRITNPEDNFNISEASLFDLITRSAYFGSATLVALGYGDYAAHDYDEVCYGWLIWDSTRLLNIVSYSLQVLLVPSGVLDHLF